MLLQIVLVSLSLLTTGSFALYNLEEERGVNIWLFYFNMRSRYIIVLSWHRSGAVHSTKQLRWTGQHRERKRYSLPPLHKVCFSNLKSYLIQWITNYFCRKNPYERQTLLLGDVQKLLQSNFNPRLPVKMYAGGWCYWCDAGGLIQRKSFNIWSTRRQWRYSSITVYLDVGDYNVIMIDWQYVAPDVQFVLPGVRLAGKHAA